MVAVIKAGSSIRNTLHYNENKVEKGQAVLLHAEHFGKDKEHLQFGDKIKRFEKLISLNEKTKVNSVHISLNFDPSEKFGEQKLEAIADEYMQKIGFANQPYLVYQHHDAGHPHIHIVTTNIQRDGSRISLHNIGRNQSEVARKEIEIKYGLVQASGRQSTGHALKPVDIRKAQYGRSETKRAITNVLDHVLSHYKYTSLHELNAVLKLYNVVADRGEPSSRIYNRRGLVFRILNDKGEKVGVPVKASFLYNKPTLKTIEARFTANDVHRQPYKQKIKNAIDLILHNRDTTLANLQHSLGKQQINAVFRQNEAGVIYGITYIDHQTKCVFNGSDLGKPYSVNAIQQRCQRSIAINEVRLSPAYKNEPDIKQSKDTLQLPQTNILQSLTQSENQFIISELKEEQKRKKKKQKHL